MSRLLAKTLKDAVREKRVTIGARQVLKSMPDSNLVVFSNSNSPGQVKEAAEKAGVASVGFDGTSVALGKLCGMQFRVSALSLRDVDASVVQSVLKENE